MSYRSFALNPAPNTFISTVDSCRHFITHLLLANWNVHTHKSREKTKNNVPLTYFSLNAISYNKDVTICHLDIFDENITLFNYDLHG